MFGNSVALVLTHDKNWFAHLHALVLQAGFKESRVFPDTGSSLSQFRRGPLPFIFIHAGISPQEVQRAFLNVRAHSDVAVRFLPIIVVTENGSAQSILRFIQMGCDDIVTLPLTAGGLIARLKHQLNRTKDYFQTDSYFGPDRRQHALTRNATHSGRGHGEHFYRHFSIQRHVQRGVSIVSTDVHFPSDAPQQQMAATG